MISAQITGAILGVFVVGGVAWNVLDRQPPIELGIEIRNPVIHPGEELEVAYQIQRARVCEGIATRTIYDGANIEHKYEPDERSAFGGVGPDFRVVHLKVPEDAAPGQAKYRLVATFKCNRFHDFWPIVVVYDDIPFTIEAKP